MSKIMDLDYSPTRRSAGVSEKAKEAARKFRQALGCPRCGGSTTRRSGLIVCRSCGHQLGTQDPHRTTSAYGQVIRRGQADLFGGNPTDPVDDEERIGHHPRGRREAPLRFED